jgi:hypothetical protein
MNNLRICRRTHANSQAITMNASVSSSLCRLCDVAPISVTPKIRAPSTGAAEAALL